MDQTRGILTNVTETCPGRFHDEIEYVTVAGKFIKGAGIREPGDAACPAVPQVQGLAFPCTAAQ